MIAAGLQSWSAWSPGREDDVAWRRWCVAPEPLDGEGRPEAKFLPPMLRRRCSSLSRIMLTAAFACCPPELRGQVRTVFASRHGNINQTMPLFERLAQGQNLSPTLFSHTVQNAQASLFSIAAENRRASSSISAQADSFACGYLEALTHLQREPRHPVLLVTADVHLNPTFAVLVEEPRASYALALLLNAGGTGPAVLFDSAGAGERAEPRPWPDALEFLRWHLGDEPSLCLGSGRQCWRWARG